LLRSAHCSIDAIADFIDGLTAIKLSLDNLISLEEALKLVGELVVLLGHQVDVSVEGFNFALLCV